MADATLPAIREVLGLPAPITPVRVQPLPVSPPATRVPALGTLIRPAAPPARAGARHATPSFFCRLVEEVVYWNTRRLPG